MLHCVKKKENIIKKCIDRKCEICGVHRLKETYSCLMSSDWSSLQWQRWENIKITEGKTRKEIVQKDGTPQEMLLELAQEVEPFAKHIFVAGWQYNQYSQDVSHIPDYAIVQVLDFAENYRCFYQD